MLNQKTVDSPLRLVVLDDQDRPRRKKDRPEPSAAQTMEITALTGTQRESAQLADKNNFKNRSHSNTICLVHEQEIVTDCALKECSFYTSYPGVKNCSLVYMKTHQLETMSPTDIGIVLKQTTFQVNDGLDQAMQLLRRKSLAEAAALELEPKFTYLHDFSVCVVCESPVDAEAISNNGYIYCSDACRLKKSVNTVTLETACNTDIGTIVTWAIKKYKTVESISQALGITKSDLDDYLKEFAPHLSVKQLERKHRAPEPVAPIERRRGRTPNFMKNLEIQFKNIQTKTVRKYGRVNLATEEWLDSFFEQLAEVR